MDEIISEFHRLADEQDVPVGHLFELAVQKVYEAWLQPGDLAVDVGAHRGAHLFPIVDAVGPRGKVIAFEPIETMFLGLRKQLKKKGIRNVTLHQLALGSKAGKAEFSYFEKRPAFSGLQKRRAPFSDEEGGHKVIEVRVATLDQKLPLFRKVSAMKLDIEGGELHVLMGARRCLKRSRPLVIFENGRGQSAKTYGYSAETFFDFFESVDMKLFTLSGASFTPADWKKQVGCWEFVALPSEKTDFAEQLPNLCRAALADMA